MPKAATIGNRRPLITEVQHEQMIANSLETASRPEHDPMPVVKLFTPCGAATWLLTELHHEDPNIAFGLCDLGMGFPELGSVSLAELATLIGPLGFAVERDRHFKPEAPLSVYARLAHTAGQIVEEVPAHLAALPNEGGGV